MKLINFKNNKSLIFSNAQSPCAIILINPKGPCIYLLMDFNDYLGSLVNVEGATSISTILLVDVDVGSFSLYKYIPTPWAKHVKTIVRGAPSLENSSCSKFDFFFSSFSRRRRRAAQPGHPLLRATSRAHPYAADVAMAVWWLYGRPKDEDEVITKLPPVRNIIVVYSF
jgi:hypothetical protein